MKRTRTNRVLSLSLTLALIFGVFSFTASAALSDNANAFIAAVEDISSASTLKDEELKLEAATDALETYLDAGGSETDAEISESYEDYLAKKEDIETRVDYCLEFIEHVSVAIDENCTYSVKKENLDKAEKLLDKIDEKYEPVSVYIKYYNNLRVDLEKPILICESFISYAKAAAESTTYAEAKRNIKNAETAKAQITIPDYPGLEEAEENLDIAASIMAMAVLKATPFIQAVRNVSKAESVPIGVMAAYAALEGVDTTAEGVSTALDNLKKIESNYNKSARGGNDTIDEITALTFGILF